jgi:hypothetical protein
MPFLSKVLSSWRVKEEIDEIWHSFGDCLVVAPALPRLQ